MQLTKKLTARIVLNSLLCGSLLFATMNPAFAESAKKTKSAAYSEDQFLNAFSGKSRKVVMEKLGAPDRKEQSIKPTGANTVLAGKGKEDPSKPVNVEMWYYNGVVNYAPKKAYKFTELTFVNDRCMNIAFFNNK